MWRSVLLVSLLFGAFSCSSQPVVTGVQRSNNQVVVTWPAGLSLVQPQKRTNLTLGSWQDYGSALTVTNLPDTVTSGTVFYRLRFLAPSISVPPQAQTNGVGSNVSFVVTATGTAPLSYQWRKNGTNLLGQIGSSMGLVNLTLNDAASYAVLITNRAGSVTSTVVALTVTNILTAPKGIYMGNFGGQVDNGGFAMLVRSNGQGVVVVGYNTPQSEGVLASGFTVAVNGGFNVATVQGGSAGGTATTTTVAGSFTNVAASVGSFSGTRKSDTGIHQSDAGYYTGTYTGAYTGNAYVVLAADGTIFFYTRSTALSDGGGFGSINAGNNLSATTVPDNLTVTGTLNPTTHIISGSYSFSGTTLGAYSVTLTTSP